MHVQYCNLTTSARTSIATTPPARLNRARNGGNSCQHSGRNRHRLGGETPARISHHVSEGRPFHATRAHSLAVRIVALLHAHANSEVRQPGDVVGRVRSADVCTVPIAGHVERDVRGRMGGAGVRACTWRRGHTRWRSSLPATAQVRHSQATRSHFSNTALVQSIGMASLPFKDE